MQFKYVTAIVRADTLVALEAKLGGLHVRGITVTKVMGFGEYTNFFSRDHLTEHIKVEAFVEESKSEALANAFMDAAHSDVPGAGVVAIMPVDKFFHIRTRSEMLPDRA